MQSTENLISEAAHPALNALEQMLQHPIPHDDVDVAYPVLVRASRRLDALRQSMAGVDETALAYANYTYRQLFSIVIENVGAVAASELVSITGGFSPARSCAELRICASSVHSWLSDILNKIEMRKSTEDALGGALSALIQAGPVMQANPASEDTRAVQHAGYI
jgi:hypothetical protein